MTSTHRWLADEAKDTRRLVPFPCLRQNPAGVRHERIPKLGADGAEKGTQLESITNEAPPQTDEPCYNRRRP